MTVNNRRTGALMDLSSVNTLRPLVAPLIAVTTRAASAFRATQARGLIIGERCARLRLGRLILARLELASSA